MRNTVKVPIGNRWTPGARRSYLPGEAFESVNQFELDTDELRLQRALREVCGPRRRLTLGAVLPAALLFTIAAIVLLYWVA